MISSIYLKVVGKWHFNPLNNQEGTIFSILFEEIDL